jgi:taurine dioxygenase
MRTQRNEIGLSICDVDAKALPGPAVRGVKDLLYRNRLIVLKDQALSDQEYCDFAGRFGFCVPYIKKDGRQISAPRTGDYRPSDTSFEQELKIFTILMPTVLPQNLPRSTRCIDMAGVYAALPQSTKNRLAGADDRRWRSTTF